MRRRWLAVILMCSCGRFAFRERDDAGAADGADAAPCTTWGAFEPPLHLAELGASGDDWGPSVTGDGLELFFFSARTAMNFDIYSATRATPDGTFSTPVRRTDVSSPTFDRTPFVSEDGLTLLLASDALGPSYDILIATREARGMLFSAPALVPNISTSNSDEAPWLSPDGLRLYFASDRQGAGDIFVATRASLADPFGPPIRIAELSSSAIERRIALSHDELEAFITSDTAGNFDVYRSTRTDLASPFSAPAPVPELNSVRDEIGISLQGTGATVFYAYDAVAAGGNAEIWSATRPCLAR